MVGEELAICLPGEWMMEKKSRGALMVACASMANCSKQKQLLDQGTIFCCLYISFCVLTDVRCTGEGGGRGGRGPTIIRFFFAFLG